jgi:hypothetical protein
MKTPIQKLIDNWEDLCDKEANHLFNVIASSFISEAKKMLEEEREVIEEAYRDGCSECGIGEPPERTAEQYYDGHFNTTDK